MCTYCGRTPCIEGDEPPPAIAGFFGAYRWLSNFATVKVELDGEIYHSVEQAYQAAKTLNPAVRKLIQYCSVPSLAKKIGKQVMLRPGWDDAMKLSVMEGLLRQKFHVPSYRRWLLETTYQEIIEDNSWGDRFWGVCRGTGENHLGKLIMKIRKELHAEG